MRHLLDIDDLTAAELAEILDLAAHPVERLASPLRGKGVACYFEKPSARTRNSTEMAVVQLGGHPVYITREELGIGHRESADDVARTLGCYHEALFARVYEHDILEKLKASNSIPVVNLLSDQAHPLQAIADLLTMQSERGPVDELNIVYVGDCNNVARSLALAVAAVGGSMSFAAPSAYRFSENDLDRIRLAGFEPMYIDRTNEITDADVVYTDTWVSMGQEDGRAERLKGFEGFQVDERLMSRNDRAVFMHCLPAHRGEEVSDEVLDGKQSRIWVQAANRLHAARAALAWLIDQPSAQA